MSSNKNPWNQLLASNRRRSKGSLDHLRLRLWHGICAAEAGLHDAMEQGDAEEVRHWLYITHQLAGTYAKIAMEADVEQRLKAVETRFAQEDKMHAGPYSPPRSD